MKKIGYMLLTTGIVRSCPKTNGKLVGRWKPVEILADPGEGSSEFHQVSSKKVLDFYAGGTMKSNGYIKQ